MDGNSKFRAAWIALLFFTSMGIRAQALTYLVGADSTVCDFDDIQSAIDAAQNHPGPDSVRIANDLSYVGLALKVGGQDLVIQGGYQSCTDALVAVDPPAGRTTLSGLGAPADSVIEITGSGFRGLGGLVLTRGDDPLSGGGIQFDGSGELVLGNVHVVQNLSSFGAGINFHGNGGVEAYLTLAEGVRILSNVAGESGGGIRLTGNATLLMQARESVVSGNEALGNSSVQQGHGGGVLIVGPARAEIASAGINGIAIGGNVARYGGGVAVLAPEDEAQLSLYASDPQHPVTIANNSASREGGGIYLGGTFDFEDISDAFVCARRYRIVDNRSPRGAAIAANESATFFSGSFGPCSQMPGTVPACPTGEACNEIARNLSVAGGEVEPGATVYVTEDGSRVSVHLGAVLIADNVGPTIAQGDVLANDVLFTGNETTGALVLLNGESAGIPWRSLTIAGNSVGADRVFEVGTDVELALGNSVIDQPGKQVALLNGGSIEAQNLLVSSCGLISCTSFPNVTAVASGPRFVDPERGDYRLQAASAAVDFAPPVSGDDRDLDGSPRDQDIPLKLNRNGVRDLGAYERQDLQPLVLNGDFVGDFHQWQPVASATATFQSTGAAGNPGGAVLISDANDLLLDEVVGLHQCVALPGPGFYRLTGMGAGQGVLALSRDRVRLRWRYYPETTTNACTGVSTQGGDVLFPNSASLSAPLADAVIGVDVAEFNEHTQVAIELVAIEGNGIGVNDPTGGIFDAIRLLPIDTPDALFHDGFE